MARDPVPDGPSTGDLMMQLLGTKNKFSFEQRTWILRCCMELKPMEHADGKLRMRDRASMKKWCRDSDCPVPRRSMQRYWRLMHCGRALPAPSGRPRQTSASEDQEILRQVKERIVSGERVTTRVIKEIACGVANDERFKAGPDWVRRWAARSGLSCGRGSCWRIGPGLAEPQSASEQ